MTKKQVLQSLQNNNYKTFTNWFKEILHTGFHNPYVIQVWRFVYCSRDNWHTEI